MAHLCSYKLEDAGIIVVLHYGTIKRGSLKFAVLFSLLVGLMTAGCKKDNQDNSLAVLSDLTFKGRLETLKDGDLGLHAGNFEWKLPQQLQFAQDAISKIKVTRGLKGEFFHEATFRLSGHKLNQPYNLDVKLLKKVLAKVTYQERRVCKEALCDSMDPLCDGYTTVSYTIDKGIFEISARITSAGAEDDATIRAKFAGESNEFENTYEVDRTGCL